MGTERETVLVIGAGVVGVTTAYLLAKNGFRVTVLEQRERAGMGTSAENGAQLSYCFADPISSPAVLKRLPAIVAGKDPGISARMGQLLRRPGWSLSFLRNCLTSRCCENTAALTTLALRSRELMAEIRASTGIDFDFSHAGRLVLYENSDALDAAARFAAERNMLGCDLRRLNPDECRTVEPALDQWQRPLAGGIYSALDEAGDAGAWCRHLAEHCEKNLDVTFRYRQAVTKLVRRRQRVAAVRTVDGEWPASQVVVCTGSATQALRQSLRIKVPILPLKGYSLTLRASEQSPRVSVASAEHRIVFARLGNRLRVAGLAHIRGDEAETDPRAVDELLVTARHVFSQAADFDSVESRWSGLRPLTPDGLPLIGRAGAENLVLNTGHGGLGWTLAAGSAELVVRILAGARLRFARGFGCDQMAGMDVHAGAGI